MGSLHRALAGGVVVLAMGGCARSAPAPARFVSQRAWAESGTWIRGDLHVHSRLSDGLYTIGDLAAKAHELGCDAIAVVDHADRKLKAATPEYRDEIRATRASHPSLAILAGLEWNVPPRGGDEHATVLVPDGNSEWDTLAAFKDRFDDYELDDKPKPDDRAALEWLASRAADGLKPVVIYNHPSRKDASSLDNAIDIERWRGVNDLVIGFEGAPGHQGREPLGGYSGALQTIDRWDPAAAKIGDAWDVLSQRGVDVHGALAGSDFHTDRLNDLADLWPCQFAETWLHVPDRTVAGVLKALRSGAFFGVHGRIVRDVELSARIPGLPRAVVSGEVVSIPEPTTVTLTLSVSVPPTDWEGRPNRLDAIEFIVVTPEGATSVEKAVTADSDQTITHDFVAGTQGLVIRARGRRAVENGPDLMFYTNAIRIRVGS
jgi:hypothetical protein